jgi:hypothetical protein
VEDGALGGADPQQRRDDLVVRVAVVDLQRDAALLGDPDVGLERALLRVAALLAGAEEVEARLADGADARAPGQLVDLGQSVVERARLGVSGRGSCAAVSADQRDVSRSPPTWITPRTPTALARSRCSVKSMGDSPSAISRCVWLSYTGTVSASGSGG